MWSGDAHLAEENVGEGFVVVLAGMDKDGLNLRMALHLADEWSDLREIGASADDIDNFQSHVRKRFEFELVTNHSTAASSSPTER